MKAYIISQTTKGVETPVVLNPGYLDIKVAESKLEELTAPRIAYYEWETAKQSYVYNSVKYLECTEAAHTSYKKYEDALKRYKSDESVQDYLVLNNKWREILADRDIAVKELELEFKEANPMPQVDWDISYTMEEVDIHEHKSKNIAWTPLSSEVIYGGIINFTFTTKFSDAIDALIAAGMSSVQIEDFFQTLGMNVYREDVNLYLKYGITKK